MKWTPWIIIVALAPVLAFGSDGGQTLAALKGYEWSAAATAARLEPAAESDLISIAADPSAPALTRMRAVSVLAEWGTDTAFSFLVGHLTATSGAQQRRVVDALCHGFSDARPLALQTMLDPVLETDDAHLRVRAANCLSGLGVESAALETYRQRVTGTWEARAAGFEQDD